MAWRLLSREQSASSSITFYLHAPLGSTDILRTRTHDFFHRVAATRLPADPPPPHLEGW